MQDGEKDPLRACRIPRLQTASAAGGSNTFGQDLSVWLVCDAWCGDGRDPIPQVRALVGLCRPSCDGGACRPSRPPHGRVGGCLRADDWTQ